MYIRLIRNKPKGNAIRGRLVIDGRWFCNTLERVGYEIPALCYHVAVTMSPKFKRLLPLVCGVPQTVGEKAMRQGIRIHRGNKPEHSTGCVLVLADNLYGGTGSPRQAGRSAADVETQLTQLILQAQEEHEEIIMEVTDFRPGTEFGYNTECPTRLQKS